MNELCQLLLHVEDGDTLTLQQGKTYHVRPEDSFMFTGYYCSNSAKKNENPDGTRYSAIYLKNKRNVVIDGNGATLMIHGKMTPFLFDACENITVKNLTVDHACPTMTEFTVLSNDRGVCEIRFHPDCRFRVEGNQLYFCGEHNLAGQPYWEYLAEGGYRFTKQYSPSEEISRDFYNGEFVFDQIEPLDEHTLRVTCKNRDIQLFPGHVIQSRNIVRDQVGGFAQRCKNLHYEALRIKFMHGLGMVHQFCENVTFLNCDLTPGEGRTIASTADFFQFSGCRGNLIIENCKASGAHDDFINVHGTHLRIIETNEAERSMTVRFMHDETWGFQAYEIGDELEWIRWDTLQPYAKATVVAYEKLNDTDIRLTVDRDLPADTVVGKDVIENATWTPNLYVRACDVYTSSSRGVLCTTRGEVIIENNRFSHLSGTVLCIEDDCNFWFESGYTNHIVFRNNQVIGCGYLRSDSVIRYTPKVMNGESEAYVHGKLTMTGNDFRKAFPGKHVLRFDYLREAEIVGNTFDAPMEIRTHRSGTVTERDNLVSDIKKDCFERLSYQR